MTIRDLPKVWHTNSQNILRSAFIVFYGYHDFVTRILFVFLQLWWFFSFVLPLLRGELLQDVPLEAHFSYYIGATTITTSVVLGLLLIIFRESRLFINAHYLLTMVTLFNFVVIYLFWASSIPSIYLSSIIGLAAIHTVDYLHYNMKTFARFATQE